MPDMRLLAWLLSAYAALGSVLIVAALLVGGPLVSRLDRLSGSAVETMSAASEAARAAADAFGGLDASVVQARTSAEDAAALSGETAATLDALATAMSLNLFGAQPLLPLADQFERSAEQMRELGGNLDGIGQALDANREDLSEVGARMTDLADELETFSGRIVDEELAGGIPLSWLYYGFLLWQLLPILAAVAAATWLFRHTRVVLTAG